MNGYPTNKEKETEEIDEKSVDTAAMSFFSGENAHVDVFLGVRREIDAGCYSYFFKTYAPGAVRVTISGDFNSWGEEDMIAAKLRDIWEYKVNSDIALEGTCYKYRIYTEDNTYRVSDMCARCYIGGENEISVIYTEDDYDWKSERGTLSEQKLTGSSPINICKLELGSFKNSGGGYLNYRDIADKIADDIHDLGYTHVHIDAGRHDLKTAFGSGRTYGLSVSPRYGLPEDFMFFVDRLHFAGIGVIIDVILPSADIIQRMTPEEESLILSCAVSSRERFRVDGIIISTNDSNLYLRKKTKCGGNTEHRIKQIATKILMNCPELLLISGVELSQEAARPFDLALDVKWPVILEDALNTTDETRKHRYSQLNYEMSNVSETRGVLTLNINGSESELAMVFTMLHPGKKQFTICDTATVFERNTGLKKFIKELNKIYLSECALWQNDFHWRGFEWIRHPNPKCGVSAFMRRGDKSVLLVVINLEDRAIDDIELETKNDYTRFDRVFCLGQSQEESVYSEEREGKKLIRLNMPPKNIKVYKPNTIFEYDGIIKKE